MRSCRYLQIPVITFNNLKQIEAIMNNYNVGYKDLPIQVTNYNNLINFLQLESAGETFDEFL